jgi:hypothetical protein
MNIKALFLILFFCSLFGIANAQKQFNPGYKPQKSQSIIQDKNFYLFTVLENQPELNKILATDTLLRRLTKRQIELISETINSCKSLVPCTTNNLYWGATETALISSRLKELIHQFPAFKEMVNTDLRPSGFFQLYQTMDDDELLLQAWKDAAAGMNYILKAYTENKDLRYGKIDSVSYPVRGEYYRQLILEMLAQSREKSKSSTLFFQPALLLSMELLAINNRDEAARYEPLEQLNDKAYKKISKVKWEAFPYSVILVPGEGPENNMPISPNNKYRCQLAADRYKKGMAPFLIVSGGNVHPFQTIYNEAIEMKRYLMEVLRIPEDAIIVEPFARHTTTNFRNATRIMARRGIPLSKSALCSTSIFQADYIIADRFKQVNLQFLKYIPVLSLKRLSDFDIEFVPNIQSLQMDSLDPLDP